jgi:hypothetical protein
MKALILTISMLTSVACSSLSLAVPPDCSGVDRYATSMAFVHLKNSGITNNDNLDFAKTETVRIASEQIDENLHRQVHLVKFTEKTGNVIEVITVNDASYEECSMSDVEVFVISKRLGR